MSVCVSCGSGFYVGFIFLLYGTTVHDGFGFATLGSARAQGFGFKVDGLGYNCP